MARGSTAAILLVCALVGAAAGWPALDNGLVWDDALYLGAPLDALATPLDALVPSEETRTAYYRPVTLWSFQLDRAIAGTAARVEDRARVHHAANVAWHALVSALVAWLAVALAARYEPWSVEPGLPNATGLVAGVLFAVHPVHAPPIAWIMGRTDVVAAAFVLLALRLATFETRPRLAALGVGLAACLAAWSKETAIALVVLVPFLPRGEPSPTSERARFATSVGAWCGITAALAMRLVVSTADRARELLSSFDLGELPAALGWYAARLAGLGPSRVYVESLSGTGWSALGALILALLFAATVASFARRSMPWSWCGLLVASTLAPALAVLVTGLIATPIAERFLYLPSAGVVLAASLGATRAGVAAWRARRRGAAFAVAAGVLVVASAGVVVLRERIPSWRDNLAFWTRAAEEAPESAIAALHLGTALREAERLEDALAVLEPARARDMLPEVSGRIALEHANVLLLMGRPEDANAAYREALSDRPESAAAWLGLAMSERHLAARAGRDGPWRAHARAALEALREAVRVDPGFVPARWRLGETLWLMGRRAEARPLLEEVIAAAPASAEADAATRLLATE